MKGAKQLMEVLKKLGSPGDAVFPAVVKAVDNDRTCTVEAGDGSEFYDVRLQSITGASSGAYLKPAVGSVVLVQQIGSSNEFAVCMASTLESMEVNIAGTLVTHDSTGWKLKKGSDTLGGILGDLLDAIQLITCPVTAVGSPTGMPVNAAQFAAIKARLEVFVK